MATRRTPVTKTATKPRAKKPAAPAPAPAQTGGSRPMRPDELMLSPPVMAAAAMEAWAEPFGEVDLCELIDGVREKTKAVTDDGDQHPIEAMLYGQAQVLDTIFVNLAIRAARQQYMDQFQAHMTLALKAQAASRATLQVLAEVKNPRAPTFVQQANIAHGPQQVNNGASPGTTPARTQEPAASPNGLMEAPQHGNVLDTGTQGAAGRVDPVLAPVGKVHGTAHR